MNRGSPGASAIRGATAKCFNEAPIHESGKYGSYPCVIVIVGSLQ